MKKLLFALFLTASIAFAQWGERTQGNVTIWMLHYMSDAISGLLPLPAQTPKLDGILVLVKTADLETSAYRLHLEYRRGDGSLGNVEVMIERVRVAGLEYSPHFFALGKITPTALTVVELKPIKPAIFADLDL